MASDGSGAGLWEGEGESPEERSEWVLGKLGCPGKRSSVSKLLRFSTSVSRRVCSNDTAFGRQMWISLLKIPLKHSCKSIAAQPNVHVSADFFRRKAFHWLFAAVRFWSSHASLSCNTHVATLRLLGGLCVKTAFIHRVSYLHLQLAPCSDAACGSGWKRQYFNGFHLFICISHMSAQQPFVPFPPQPCVLEVRCRVEVHLWKATQGVIFSLPDTLLHCEGKWCYIINQTNQETSAVFTQADIKNKL